MTNQSEPLAALRAAIDERVRTLRGTVLHYVQWHHSPPAYDRADDAKKALDAELAAVEARIGRLVRLAKAYDAVMDAAYARDQDNRRWSKRSDDFAAARAALTESDL